MSFKIPRVTRLGAIDLGSNAVRLKVAETYSPKFVVSLESFRRPFRLGSDVFSEGKISYSLFKDGISYFKEMFNFMKKMGVDRYLGVGTSALRDAVNGQEFIETIEEKANIKLEIITGDTEANYLFKAINKKVDLQSKKALLIDLGGGSVELTVLDKGEKIKSRSINVGTVRALAKMEELGLGPKETNKLIDQYRPQFSEFFQDHDGSFDIILGTGGNCERYAKIKGYMAQVPSCDSFSIEDLRQMRNVLEDLSLEERVQYFKLRHDRADVIIPAGSIIQALLEAANGQEMFIPRVGLRDGVLFEMNQNPNLGHPFK